MDELIKRIISIINEREQNTLVLSCRTPSPVSQGIRSFLYNKHIHLTEVDILFLERFIKKDEQDPLVKWLYQSYSYDCRLTFELAFSNTDLIPNELFNECSVRLLNNQGEQYFLLPKRVITYQQVAMLTQQDILLIASNQLITDLARDRLRERKVVVEERMSVLLFAGI